MNETAIIRIAGLTIALLLVGCEKEVSVPVSAPKVEVATIAEGPISESIYAVGVAKAYDEVNLVARVEGYLISRNFQEGQMVKKGDLLYEIEPALFHAKLEMAEAELAKTKANLSNVTEEYNRQKTLLHGDATSKREYQNAEAEKLSTEAEVRSCEANIETAKQNLEYTRITAPFDGWIGLSSVSVGNLVNLETGTLAKIVKTDPMRIEFVVTEMDILKMQEYRGEDLAPEMKVSLVFQDGSVYPLEGKISFWNNEISSSTGTLKLQAVFPNPERHILPGMFVRVKLEPRHPSNKLLLPLTSLMNDQAGDYVYIIDSQNIARRQNIRTGFRGEEFAVVTTNLKPGDQVVVKGLQKVRPGSAIEPINSDGINPLKPTATPPELKENANQTSGVQI